MSSPIVVAYGLGVDSTAILVGMKSRGQRPDKILFADVGAEKDETYAYLEIIGTWLKDAGFPPVTVVRYVPKKFKHWPPYYSLEENCLTNGTLPSIAFGFNSCSQKWKHAPQHAYLKQWEPAVKTWESQDKVIKIIGYDASPRDQARRATADRLICTYKAVDAHLYDYRYLLQDWGWDRDLCKAEIRSAGLPVPPKSSCFFCTAMKPEEVLALPHDKLRRIVLMESRAEPRLTSTVGLWRKPNKKQDHRGSMTEFIVRRGLLSAEEVERIRQVPAQLIAFQEDFASGRDRISLGEFLRREFPEMYAPLPENCELAEVDIPESEIMPTAQMELCQIEGTAGGCA